MGDSTSAFTDQRVKNWNYLLTSDAPFQIESIRIIESNIFAPQTITLPRAVALIGLHGTGKTLLLRLLEAAFGGVNKIQAPPFFRQFGPLLIDAVGPAMVKGTIEVTLRTPNGLISHVVDLDVSGSRREDLWKNEPGDSYSVWYTNPLQAFDDLIFMFQEYDVGGLHRIDRTRTSRELTADELHSARNMLGRYYDHLSIETIEVSDYPVPYFSGTYRSRKIDSSTMSSGELWVHYINWWLHDRIAEGSLVLIDEPETFLAARGRRPFIDQIALGALRRKMQLITATHSPEVLARFPLDNIRMCLADTNGILVRKPESLVQIQDIVGMSVPVQALALVEDDLAKQLLSEMFSQYDIALTREVEIIPVGGASEVVSGLRIFQQMNRLKVAGILDADERPKIQSRVPAKANSIFFLPGNHTPEEELLSAGRREAAWIAEIMGRTVNDIIIAINSCENLDHQYQIRYLASQFGRSESAVIFIFTQAWLHDGHIGRQAEMLVKGLRESVTAQKASGGDESR